jgi:hypothetical protein
VNAWRARAARTPACLGAWLAYGAILLLLTLPLLALIVAIFFASVDVGPSGLLLLLVLLMLGAILLSTPLAWASVAYGLAPFCSAVAARGPIAAQTASRLLVRGHWTHTAIVISLPMLIYFGAASAISSFTLALAGAATYAVSGWLGLLDGRWLLWSQLAALVPTALVLPLAFAGGVVCLNDLTLRQAADR